MKDKFSYNLILLGGTGARCGEIFIHMCANGYFNAKTLNILYIDSDIKNGNANYFKRIIELYQECRKQYLIKESPIPYFFKTEINLMIENPVQGIKYFRDLASKSNMKSKGVNSAEKLMKALYSEEECNMKISEGFFAHPNVGAALFAANIDKIMDRFLKIISIEQRDMKKIKIFMIGSIFGGTGASSLPTISKYLKNTLFNDSNNKLISEQLQIGGCMVLPYFAFSRNGLIEKLFSENEIEIEADKFVTKTKAALKYYNYIDSDYNYKVFDSLYILGHDGGDVRGKYETAGALQRNLPHIVELCTAMSGVNFFESKIEEKGHYFMSVPVDKIGWGSLYKSTKGFFNFFIMMRFSIVIKSLILEELFDYKEGNKLRKEAKSIPWYYDFLDGKDISSDMNFDKLYSKFESISLYCTEYIRWFAELNISNIDKVKIPNKIDLKEKKKRETEEEHEESDVVEYLQLFSKEIIIKQYMNNLIRDGLLSDKYSENDKQNIYKENLEYIKNHLQDLETNYSYTDRTDKITMNKIWSRLSDFGFNFTSKDKEVFKNISCSTDKSMEAGVRNLINAVYIACMI